MNTVNDEWIEVLECDGFDPKLGVTFTHTVETCPYCDVRIGFIGSKKYLFDNYCPNCGQKLKKIKERGRNYDS